MKYFNQTIEDGLQQFKPVIGADYEKYRNHVYRVFLNCLIIDGAQTHEDKYAVAAVFHDIGIWTNHTIDYLLPSIDQAEQYLTETGRQDWIEEITLMINWHHKVRSYSGAHKEIVENFRKADWIDVSLGWLHFGISRQKVRTNRKLFPNRGFHLFLLRQIAKNFVRHPLNPLPMFKK